MGSGTVLKLPEGLNDKPIPHSRYEVGLPLTVDCTTKNSMVPLLFVVKEYLFAIEKTSWYPFGNVHNNSVWHE